jgi:hypothetical protein
VILNISGKVGHCPVKAFPLNSSKKAQGVNAALIKSILQK